MTLRTLADFRPYQHPAVDFMVRQPRCAALLRPGLGKTCVAMTAGQRLGVRRTLVGAPAQVVEAGVWSSEAAKWEHLSHLRVCELRGDAGERELAMMLGADIVVCSYDLLVKFTDEKRWRHYFDAIVYDELSKMKHPGTKRFKRMRAWAKDIPVRFGLTGSPMGNSWEDLWGEMFVTAGAAALGPTKEQYLDTYFKQVFRAGTKYPVWELRQDGSDDAIRARIRPYAFSISAKLAKTELPSVVLADVPVELPAKCRAMERKLREELEVELASGKTLFMLNNSKLAAAIRQLAAGAIYTNEERTEWEEIHDAKLRAVQDRIEEMQGAPLLIFTWFRHTTERLLKRFPGMEKLTGDAVQIARWNRKEIPGMVLHPQGSGHGLNLQFGGDATLWYDLPWSRELFDQGNGRVARLGQVSPFVTSTALIAGTIDRRIWRALQDKGAAEESVIEAVALPG